MILVSGGNNGIVPIVGPNYFAPTELVDTTGSRLPSCDIPMLPWPFRRSSHTQTGLTACGGECAHQGSEEGACETSCHTLSGSPGAWEWTKSHTWASKERVGHSAWASPQGIVLLGGSSRETEILMSNGGTKPGFTLNYDTR